MKKYRLLLAGCAFAFGIGVSATAMAGRVCCSEFDCPVSDPDWCSMFCNPAC